MVSINQKKANSAHTLCTSCFLAAKRLEQTQQHSNFVNVSDFFPQNHSIQKACKQGARRNDKNLSTLTHEKQQQSESCDFKNALPSVCSYIVFCATFGQLSKARIQIQQKGTLVLADSCNLTVKTAFQKTRVIYGQRYQLSFSLFVSL